MNDYDRFIRRRGISSFDRIYFIASSLPLTLVHREVQGVCAVLRALRSRALKQHAAGSTRCAGSALKGPCQPFGLAQGAARDQGWRASCGVQVQAIVLANLCVAYVMTSANEDAEELMRQVGVALPLASPPPLLPLA